MKTGTLGAAVVTGYLLGRFHKTKWALAIAAVAGGKRLAGKQGQVVGQATEMAKGAGLDKLTGDLRGRLVEAGKAAAVSAVSSKIESFSEGLHSRSESLRGDGRPGRDAEDAEEPEGAEESSDAAEDEEPEDREDEEPEDREDEEPEDREDEDRPAARKRTDGRRPARGGGNDRPPRRRGEDGRREPARPARRRSSDGDQRQASGSRRGGNR
jgi:hypothetical protein